MSLSSLFKSKPLVISFELFPPKTDKGVANLMKNVKQLMEYEPDFITCTYGAGGSTQDKTLDIVSKVKSEFKIPVASHLTCVGSTTAQLKKYLDSAKQAGIDYIVALRGDPPEGSDTFVQTDGGLQYANELVELIQSEFKDFGIAVAGYPEKHREAPSMEVDLENLKRKVDAGADIILTQLFYDNDDFFRFRDQCNAIGINVPIIPGLLPVTSLKQVQRIASLCAAKLPKPFIDQLSKRDDPEWHFEVGVAQAVEQTRGLLDAGVQGLHYYVLNKSNATRAIMAAVDIAAARAAQ